MNIAASIVKALRGAGEDGLTTGDLIFEIYEDDRPDNADATVRTAIARHNRKAGADEIKATGGYNSRRRWFLLSAYESKLAREASQGQRMRPKFIDGAQPRFGR